MKILQVIDTLDVGGAEKILVTLANIQHRHGMYVSVLTLLEPGPLATQIDPDVPVLALRRGWKFNPLTMFQFFRIASQFDLIHVHSPHNLRYVYLSIKIFKLNRPIFFHEHFGDIGINNSTRWHERLIYPNVHLIGVSKGICDWAIQKVGMVPNRVHLLHNIVQNAPFQQAFKTGGGKLEYWLQAIYEGLST